MIFGIGVDVMRIARMAEAVERHGDRFARRILADSEIEAFERAPSAAALLAKRFAAKEALLKALGTGLRDGITWHDMAVGHDALGKPVMRVEGRVGELFAQHAIASCHLSLSDEREYAVAFVVLEV